jgi:hypothetical protein
MVSARRAIARVFANSMAQTAIVFIAGFVEDARALKRR